MEYQEYQKILVALDSSSMSQTVFRRGVVTAKQNNASLMLCYCLTSDSPFWVQPTSYHSETTEDFKERYQESLEKANQWLAEYVNKAQEQGIATELTCQVDKPEHLILEIAKNWEADLIVVGRRGRRGLTEIFLGSVSNYIVHYAPCSLLIVQDEGSS
ncbi:MAG: universal stress protein [Xenococcus sp. MO_188.B8]|nr:universal stress protein [Xenococcus sp. MO_188.B8]